MDTQTRPTTDQPRHAAGMPHGGRWRPTLNAEAVGVDLADPEVLADVERLARFEANRYGQDVDDVYAETVVALLRNRDNRKAKIAAGEPVEPIGNPGGYIRITARSASYRLYSDHLNSDDMKALKIHRVRVAAMEQRLGRDLSAHELDRLAEEIVAEQPAQRRPKDGFHYGPGREVAYTPHTMEAVLGDRAAYDTSSQGDQGPSAVIDGLLDKAEGTQQQRLQAARQLWDGLAAMRGNVPMVEVGSQTERQIAKARRAVTGRGGAAQTVRAWRDGEATDDEQRALFLAFGDDLDDDDRKAVADLIEDHPKYADEIFDAALRQATKPR